MRFSAPFDVWGLIGESSHCRIPWAGVGVAFNDWRRTSKLGSGSIWVFRPAQSTAYLADSSVPGNLRPGTNTILKLAGSELERAGVHPVDLLVST
jgi:hypothetical protein